VLGADGGGTGNGRRAHTNLQNQSGRSHWLARILFWKDWVDNHIIR
jgi:hypothetical protein